VSRLTRRSLISSGRSRGIDPALAMELRSGGAKLLQH
jgi:hypothetical protein